MKYYLTTLLLVATLFAKSTVIYVDNSPNSVADYSSIEMASRAASSGDTIVVNPSHTNYGSFGVNSKKLYVYSNGHSIPLVNPDKKVVVSGSISISRSGANGTIIRGLKARNIEIRDANNVTIENCFFTGSSSAFTVNIRTASGTANNNIFKGNVVTLTLGKTKGMSIVGNNNIATNNLFIYSNASGTSIGPSARFLNGGNSTTVFTNNICIERVTGTANISGGGIPFVRFSAALVQNNIFWSNLPTRSAFDSLSNNGAVFKNNVTYSVNNDPDSLTTINNNYNYNDTMPLFMSGYNDTIDPVYSDTANFRLETNSIGKNGGTDGNDVGIFGRNFLFEIRGYVPGVALIEEFEIENTILKAGDNLKVRIRARNPNQ